MPTIAEAAFGRTGHVSTRTLFGAAALGRVTQQVADQALAVLLEYGINHIDTAASYGDAELRIGPWMAEHRQRFFLATKTGERTYQAAHDQIRKSLERMRVDSFDLIQLHNLVDEGEWEVAMGDDGALKAAIEAREEGLVRFIGVTGHGVQVPVMHKRSLERFDFDSVLLPYNYVMMQNPQYARDFEALVALCQSRNVAVQTIKSLTRRPWDEGQDHFTSTWYEPFTEQGDIDLAVHWVLGRPGVFLNTSSDVGLLPKILDAASRFQARPGDAEMDALVERQKAAPLFT
jgi:aryl-alcohol dehydrogenase-like predicted oxidoreductase